MYQRLQKPGLLSCVLQIIQQNTPDQPEFGLELLYWRLSDFSHSLGRFLPFRELPVKSENWPVTPQLRADKLTHANSWSFFVPFNH
jgi:hypothetical protein